MRLNKLSLAVALVALATPLATMAKEAAEAAQAESNWSWSIAGTSDYVFRGVTQSNFDPALQAGLKYDFSDSGFYAGTWASNVDYNHPDSPDMELDAYVGWNKDVAEDWNLDLQLVRYHYLGADEDAYGNVDYNELIAKTTWNEMLSFTLAYANDYGNADYSSLYLNLGGSWELGNEFSLAAGVGYTELGDANGHYTDWNLGLSRPFGPVTAALTYYDTDLQGGRASDSMVLTLSLGN